jgi:ABC-type antimicrobial peptide transport system permease subunit
LFRNYLKIALRNLIRRKFFSSLNIFGLSIGIAFAFIIAGYAWQEAGVNHNIEHVERFYLLKSIWKEDTGLGSELKSLPALSKELRRQYPNLVENYYRWDWVSSFLSVGEKHFRDSLQIGDSTFITMFNFPVLHGNKHTMFDNPDAVVITESKAIKLFGQTDVIGKRITIVNYSGKQHDFTVTGVLKDLPFNSVTNSIIPVNASINSTFLGINGLRFFYGDYELNNWNFSSLTSYVKLKEGVKPEELEQPIKQLIASNADDYIKTNLQVKLAPLATFNLDANNGLIKKMIITLSLIAVFILCMAIINFINISISSSASRLKEIGVRKVLGGMRKHIIRQLLTESIITVLFSMVVALVIYQASRSFFGEIFNSNIPSLLSFPVPFIILPIALVLLVGTTAGVYPAFVLSAIKSVELVKGKLKSIKDNIALRRTLIGVQFGIAIIVLTSAIIITQQVFYVLNKDLGFNKDQIINVALPRNWTAEGVASMQTLRNEIANTKGVTAASLTYSVPNRNAISLARLYTPKQDSAHEISTNTFITDEYFARTFEVKMAAGKFFAEPNEKYDSSKIVINEAAARALGFVSMQDAIGTTIRMSEDPASYTISGIVKDYHFESKHESIKPLLFYNVRYWTSYRFISLKLAGANPSQTIAAVQTKWNTLMPSTPFEYTFMDDTIQKAYQTEIHLKKAAYTATVLAAIIVMLGIIGLISLSIQKRVKEIGIRKVLGASASSIISLFIRDFIIVAAAAGIIACPLAFLFMKHWLNDYAYRISITPMPFVIALIALFTVTIGLISFQVIRSTLLNPVNSLRSE